MRSPTLALMILLLGGCGSTYQFGQEPGNPGAERALSAMIGQECTLILLNGEEYEGRLITWTSDTLVFGRRDTGLPYWVPTSRISCVREDHSRIPGTLVGALVGGGIGALIGSGTEDKKEGWFDLVDEHQAAITMGAALGGTLGGIVGYAGMQNRTTVRFAAQGSEIRAAMTQVVGLLVPALSEETDSHVAFSISGKTYRLPRAEVHLERRSDGILIRATRKTFELARVSVFTGQHTE